MMEKEHLHLLIDEEIYLIKSDDSNASSVLEKIPESTGDIQSPVEVKEPHSSSIHIDMKEINHPHKDETPKIPEVHHEITMSQKKEVKLIPLAVFHEATNTSEIDLLQKIIDACELNPDDYQVFANGFNKEVKFKKGLVFTSTAKAYYTPIAHQSNEFLCAQPLSILVDNIQEKAKLWEALKKFLT